MNKGITYKSLAIFILGMVAGIYANANLQAREGSEFETAALHLQAPFHVDSVEPARWGN